MTRHSRSLALARAVAPGGSERVRGAYWVEARKVPQGLSDRAIVDVASWTQILLPLLWRTLSSSVCPKFAAVAGPVGVHRRPCSRAASKLRRPIVRAGLYHVILRGSTGLPRGAVMVRVTTVQSGRSCVREEGLVGWLKYVQGPPCLCLGPWLSSRIGIVDWVTCPPRSSVTYESETPSAEDIFLRSGRKRAPTAAAV